MSCLRLLLARVYDREESIERRHTVHQMYAESNVTSCICHKLGICTLTNPSVGDVESRLHHPHVEQLIDYITHSWIGQCANSKLVTDTGCHVTLRIHLIHSMPT